MNEAHIKRVAGGKQFSEVPAGRVEPAEEPVAKEVIDLTGEGAEEEEQAAVSAGSC